MRLITQQTLANGVIKKWAEQYPKSGTNYGRDKQKVLKDLKDLGSNPSPYAISKVIGNPSWTDTNCDECSTRLVPVIRLGDEPDYDSSTANICRGCLVKALELIDGKS